jgi:hypothetical protein
MLGGKHGAEMPTREEIVADIERQIASLQRGLEMMETGVLTTGNVRNGWLEDQTAETAKQYRQIIAELRRCLEQVKAGDL